MIEQQQQRKTIVLGATNNPSRYAYRAAHMLVHDGHIIIPVGIKSGEVAGKTILDLRQRPMLQDIDTVTLYIGSQHQAEWVDYIIGLQPRRIIFNPGTENPALAKRAAAAGIQTEEACTLVMLQLGVY